MARRLAILLLPALVFLALRANSLDYAFVWTDQGEILQETALLPAGRIHQAFARPFLAGLDSQVAQPYYRPIQVTLASSIHHFFGKRPRAFRLAGLAFGAATLILFTGLALQLFGRAGPALFAGMLPAVHPAGIEVYVWIAALSEPLADFFIVVGLLTGLWALHTTPGGWRKAWVATSILSLLLGMLSKELAVVLPALLLALALSLFARDWLPALPRPRDVLAALPRHVVVLVAVQALLALAYLLLWRPIVLGGAAVSAAPPMGGNVFTHAWTALAVWPQALGWLLFPLQATTSDVVHLATSPFDVRPWLGLALAAGSLLACLWLVRRGRVIAAFGLAWIWIAYLPTANLVPALHARADRYVFLSSFGLALLLADLVPALFASLPAKLRRVAPVALAALWLGFLAQRTWDRLPDWRSNLTLFGGDVERDPDYREGRYWLSLALMEAGLYQDAHKQLDTLIGQMPELPGRASFISGSPYELYCRAKVRSSRHASALKYVAELWANQPKLSQAPGLRLCRAEALEALERYEAALQEYEALAREKLSGERLLGAARCNAKLGRAEAARRWFEQLPDSLRQQPDVQREVQRIERRLQRLESSRRR